MYMLRNFFSDITDRNYFNRFFRFSIFFKTIILKSFTFLKPQFQIVSNKTVEYLAVYLVTVYNCRHLARDCNQCKALNSTKYQCLWCHDGHSNYCGYTNAKGCIPENKCPPPVITKVMFALLNIFRFRKKCLQYSKIMLNVSVSLLSIFPSSSVERH